MATDFGYNNKTIVAGGPIKPNGKDMPIDSRTRVETYADISSIPNPYVGMKITVKADETNNNEMTDYIVKSLKANSLGVENSVIAEVVRYVDYLGVSASGGSGEGLTTEQIEQLNTAYEHSQSPHVQASDIPSLNGYATKDDLKTKANTSHTHITSDITDLDLSNIDAASLNGKKLSNLMTKDEYDAIDVKEPNTIYIVDDNTVLEGIPSYSVSDAGKVLAVNSTGTGLVWITLSSSGGGSEEPKTLNSISAVYTQGNTVIYPSTSLDSLKSNLVVTATYSDNSNSVISSGYSLSGNLTVGTSTITVTYSGKTTTFNVTVTEESTPGMDSAYSYLKVTVPASATTEQSTLYLSKPTRGTMSSLYINDVPKDVPTGTNQTTTGYSLNEGENIIKIKGNFTCWNSKCNIDALQLQNDLTTCSGMFYGCPNITFNATIPSTVTNTNAMFRGSGLVNGVDIPSSVTNTASMYQSVGTLKTPSIVPDTVTLCDSMYGGCVSLQGTVNVPNSATDISSFLNSAGTNGEGISVTGINTSSVTNYNLAFYGAKITTIEQSFADLIKQAKPATVTKSICFKASDTNLSSPITIAEVHSDWKH